MAFALSVCVFMVVTWVFAFIFHLGIELAFQTHVGVYGMWIIVVAAAAFCILFLKDTHYDDGEFQE